MLQILGLQPQISKKNHDHLFLFLTVGQNLSYNKIPFLNLLYPFSFTWHHFEELFPEKRNKFSIFLTNYTNKFLGYVSLFIIALLFYVTTILISYNYFSKIVEKVKEHNAF